MSSGIWTAPTKAGVYTIQVSKGGITTTFVVTVVAGRPAQISVEPADLTVNAGQSVQFRAVVLDLYGNTVPGVAAWGATGGTITTSGLFTASRTESSAIVTASYGNVSRSVFLRVNLPPRASKVVVEPHSVTVTEGQTVQFRAVVTNIYGGVVASPRLRWSATGGSVSSSGLFSPQTGARSGSVIAHVDTDAGEIVGVAQVQIKPTPQPPKKSANEVVRPILLAVLSQNPKPEDTWAHRSDIVSNLVQQARSVDLGLSETQVLTALEEQLTASANNSAQCLDLLFEVKTRLGRSSNEARGILKRRLEQEPHTRGVYEALFPLSKGAGELHDLDTFVHGKQVSFDVRPKVKEGRTLVPLRAIVEAVGATVGWDQNSQAITIHYGSTEVVLRVGDPRAKVNGKVILLDAPAELDGSRTMVPLRFIGESLGLSVSWYADYKVIVVTGSPLK